MADAKNLKTLVEFRKKGEKVKVGEVIAKSSFPTKGEWLNLVNMKPPRLEETDEPVGKPAVEKPAKVKKAANKEPAGGMPGA